MHAVLDAINMPPDIYVFNDKETAQEFLDWLADTDPDNDGSDEYRDERYTVVETRVPPEYWNKSL